MESGRNMSKTRNWGFLAYPESVPENWVTMLEETHIPCFISPIHDRDMDSDGVLKKEHFHVILLLDGPITKKRADELIAPFAGTKSAEAIKSKTGYVRYLAHLDENPETTAIYNPNDIVALNGADLDSILKPSVSDVYRIIGEVMMFCKENYLHELSALLNYAIANRADWFRIISDKPYLFSQFLHSLRHSQSRNQ